MSIRDLAEVGARLEETVRNLPGDDASLYEKFECTAFAVLDSQYMDFEPGELQSYLAKFLAEKRTELGLPPFTGAES